MAEHPFADPHARATGEIAAPADASVPASTPLAEAPEPEATPEEDVPAAQ